MIRQVPETNKIKPFAIVGNGKMARHMIRYCECVSQPYVQWMRKTNSIHSITSSAIESKLARFKNSLQRLFNKQLSPSLADVIDSVETVLLLISDDQIESFIAQNPCLNGKKLIHFSGALYTDKAQGCHPLMTFGGDYYSAEKYQKIPFVVDEGVDFKTFFPLFSNPVHSIKPTNKVRYHAMCVMAGNFSQMMWQAISQEMKTMGFPTNLLSEYLLQNTQNFTSHPEHSATGPFVRGDINTIKKHQQALKGHELAGLYQAFFDFNEQRMETLNRSQL